MKLLNKEVPVDYKYTIELSHKELIAIRDYIFFYYLWRDSINYKDNLLQQIDDILKTNKTIIKNDE